MENGNDIPPGEKVDPAPLEEHETSTPNPEIEPPPDMPETNPDEFKDIGEDALIEILKTARKVVASEEFQRRLVPQVNRVVNVPYMPETLEAEAMDQAYDLVQTPAKKALDNWIKELQEEA